jgi:predicted ArsR family transcriptional regulator
MNGIATTRTLRRILTILKNGEPQTISQLNQKIQGFSRQHVKDGLAFLISVGVVEKITPQNYTAVLYQLKKK